MTNEGREAKLSHYDKLDFFKKINGLEENGEPDKARYNEYCSDHFYRF